MSSEGRVLLEGLMFPEGPRWRGGKLWFSDMHACAVSTVDEEGRSELVAEVPNSPSGLGWLPDGRLLIVSMTDRRLLRREADGSLIEVADLSSLAAYHCNDMVVDQKGRAYIGNFGFDLLAGAKPTTTDLVLVTPDGQARVVAEKLAFPNGTVITPDGRTLIVGETFAARLTAFDVEPDGSLANRRIWAALEGAAPDGICLDADGGIWVASPVSAEVLRVEEGGRVTDRIGVSTQAFACMLGGADGRTLFVCTATTAEPDECRRQRSGRIEVFPVEIARAGLP